MINFKNLSKALKYSKFPVFWFKTEKYSYLLTGYWGIKTTRQLHIEKGIFTTLINTFQAMPEISQGYKFMNKFEGAIPMETVQIKNFTELIEKIPETELTYTRLIHKRNEVDEDVVLRSPNNYIFVDRMYMDFIDITSGTKLYGLKPNNAVYAQKDEEIAMILPVRYGEIPEYLKSGGGANE